RLRGRADPARRSRAGGARRLRLPGRRGGPPSAPGPRPADPVPVRQLPGRPRPRRPGHFVDYGRAGPRRDRPQPPLYPPADLADSVRHLILPAGTLGLVMAAAVARFTRSTVLNTLGQDFVRTARAKGLPAPAVMARHTLRAALIPIVSLAGLWSIALIGDSVTTEIVFARPGLGSMMVGTMLQRDYTSLQSVMVVYTAFVVLINLATDVAYGFIDPRIRY